MPKAYETIELSNPLAGKKLRYLIGKDDTGAWPSVDVIECGYDGMHGDIAYCNLFDEKFAETGGKYPPYLHDSDTAADYNEGQIDPNGAGWLKNLHAQFMRRSTEGFKIIELDNPDAYHTNDVLRAYQLASVMYGFKLIAKNPGICKPDPVAMVAHSAVVGIIVEKGCGDPQGMDKLRKAANKPDLPVWFVCFDRGKRTRMGLNWGESMAIDAKKFTNMYVSYSKGGEYVASIDL